MFCVRCGAEIVSGNAFCGKCGTPVGNGQVIEKDVTQETQRQWQLHCPRCGKGGLQAQSGNRVVSSTTMARSIGKKHAIGSTSYNSIIETYWFCNSCGMKFRDLDELQAIVKRQQKTAKNMKIMLIVMLIVFFVIGIWGRMMGDRGFILLKMLIGMYLILWLPLCGLICIWAAHDAKKKEAEYVDLLPKVKGNR